MFDCSKDVVAFHKEEVTLPRSEQTVMRNRRNSNRHRLKLRLKAVNDPTPKEFIKQGSYAMLTMVQDADKDYDIDDGVYYTQVSLRDSDGNDMQPKEARQMICDVLKDDRFNKQPQVKRNCARVFYEEGYHVDLPLYRIRESDGEYELASGDEWVVSRAADVEQWFKDVNSELSPENNGHQFRHIVRMLKKFARSRKTWKDKTASGFTITKLAEEHFVADSDRIDVALRMTMQCIYDRLLYRLEVDHPVTPNSKLTSGPNDEKSIFFRDKLHDVLIELEVLDKKNVTQKEALNAWDKVFNTSFFSGRCKEETAKSENSLYLVNLISPSKSPEMSSKVGGERFA